jgi:hypothetical protein
MAVELEDGAHIGCPECNDDGSKSNLIFRIPVKQTIGKTVTVMLSK